MLKASLFPIFLVSVSINKSTWDIFASLLPPHTCHSRLLGSTNQKRHPFSMCETIKIVYCCEHREETDYPCERARAMESSGDGTPCTERFDPSNYTDSAMLCNACHSEWFRSYYNEHCET